MPKRNRQVGRLGPRYLRKISDLPRYVQYGKAAWDTYQKLKPILATPSKRGYQAEGRRYRVPNWMPYGRGLIQKGLYQRKKMSKKSRERQRLLKLGVTYNAQPRFILDNTPKRYVGSQGFKYFVFFTPTTASYGINSKGVLNSVASVQSLTDPESKVCLARQVDSMMISNSSNGGVYITVYWMQFKKNWTTTMGSNLNVDLLQAGFNDSGLAGANEQLLNATIFQNKKVMSWMKLVKTQKTYLSAGGVRKFEMIDPNIHIRSLYYKSEADIAHLRGEIMPLIVFHGTPVHDDTNPLLVSTAGAALDIVRHRSIKTYAITQGAFAVTDTDSLSTVATPVRFIDNDKTEVAVADGS